MKISGVIHFMKLMKFSRYNTLLLFTRKILSLSKVDCKISASFGLIQNFKVSNLAMAKLKKVKISYTQGQSSFQMTLPTPDSFSPLLQLPQLLLLQELFYTTSLTLRTNKLKCLSLESLFSLVQYLWARLKANLRIDHWKGAPLGEALAKCVMSILC
jgi:hypothetical protein